MLIHLPDETPIIDVIKFAAAVGCEIQYSSANVLRFSPRSNGVAQAKVRQFPRTVAAENQLQNGVEK